MAKSSINFQKASEHSSDHNFRKDKPNYLLPKKFQLDNEFWKHEKSEEEIFNDELSRAKRKGGRKPKLENSRWEAVLNLNKKHTLEDVKKVAEHIEKKFNITCPAIAIHRDEGFVENDKPQYNYHAHINFVTYKNGKQNWRREHIKPKNLSELQTEIAELLEMERGQVNSKAVRLEHKQHKQRKQEEAKILAKQKDLKAEIARLREKLKEQGAIREDYAQLEQLTQELKEQIENKDLTINELEKKAKQYKQTAINRVNEANEIIKNKNKSLSEAQKTILNQKKIINNLELKVEQLEKELKEYRGRDRQIKRKEVNKANHLLNQKRSEMDKLIKKYPELSKYKNIEQLREQVPELWEPVKNPNFENKYEIKRLSNNQNNNEEDYHNFPSR